MKVTKEESGLGKILWDYFQLGHEVKNVDVIVGMGSIDMLPAKRAAELFLEGYSKSPYLIFTGGSGGRFSEQTPKKFIGKTEAEQMAITAEGYGVNKKNILIENESKNTKENVINTLELLAKKGICAENIMSVHMPSAGRRDYGTWKNFTDSKIIIVSPTVSYEDYHKKGFQGQFTHHDIISTLVGNIQRTLLIYPAKGDMIQQKITPEAKNAYHELIGKGYVEHLIERNYKIPDSLVENDLIK